MLILIPAEDGREALRAELHRTWPDRIATDGPAGLLQIADPAAAETTAPLPPLAFARQALPDAEPIHGASIKVLAEKLFDAITAQLPDDQSWRLHVAPHFGTASPDAGRHRAELIREHFRDRMQRQRRRLLRQLDDSTSPFLGTESLVQLILTEPEHGFLSVSVAPAARLHHAVLSPFEKGEIPVASDKAAPCRAFAKLAESELRLGRMIAPGESCVDLGASPGSWSYVALRRGARVQAVDRSPLRPDLMRNPALTFHRGDAFTFTPDKAVDWLLCDVIAAPDRSIDLVLDWCRRRLCRRFVVTIKFKGTADYATLDRLKRELPDCCDDFLLTRLCANKNEACVMGRTIPDAIPPERKAQATGVAGAPSAGALPRRP